MARKTVEALGPLEARLGPLGAVLGRLAAPFYGLGIAAQNWRYDRGIGVRRAPGGLPVISVGNLTAGGTGKTPTVVWAVRRLLSRGHWPAVALRGYRPMPRPRGLAADVPLVGRWSDEVDELLRVLPGTPIIAQPDRRAGIAEALERAAREGRRPPDVVILDDGFQHRKLARDFDLVVIDATRDPRRDRLLPAGWLREGWASLRRADAVVLNRFDAGDPGHADLRRALESEAGLRSLRGGRPLPVFTATGAWAGLRGVPGTPAEDVAPVSWLEGRRLVVVCGIGNPAAFLRQVRATAGSGAGGGVVGGAIVSLFFPDHHRYRAKDVDEIAGVARAHGGEAIVTTEKDWSKLRSVPEGRWPCPVVRPLLTLAVEGASALEALAIGVITDGAGARSTRS